MRNNILFLITSLITINALSQPTNILYKYKKQYNNKSAKDSNTFFIGMDYYNTKKSKIKSTVFGPRKNESCSTNWTYNKNNQIIKEITTCSDGKVEGLRNYEYVYGEDGKIIQEKFIQEVPYFMCTVTRKNKDSLVKKSYLSKSTGREILFENKYVELYNNLENIIHSFTINVDGDTTLSQFYLYFALSDTAKVSSHIIEYIAPNSKQVTYQVVYLNDFNKEVRVDYYDSSRYIASTFKKYNKKNNLLFESHYSALKDRIINKINYTYTNDDVLLQKRDENFDELTTKVYTFNKKIIIREDYYYDKFLDHSIIYKTQKRK